MASEKLWPLNIRRNHTNLPVYRTMNSNYGPAVRKNTNTMRDPNETMRPRQDPGADINVVRRTLNECCQGPRSSIALELSSKIKRRLRFMAHALFPLDSNTEEIVTYELSELLKHLACLNTNGPGCDFIRAIALMCSLPINVTTKHLTTRSAL